MSEANRQASHDALELSRKRLASGQLEDAIRWATKAVALNGDSGAARSFLKELEALAKEGSQPQASTSKAAPPVPEASRPNRTDSSASDRPAAASDRPAATPKQVAAVKRVRALKVHQYYEILEVEKSCDDVTIKKAFRKMVLLTHPDKCSAPGSDEAFKMVAKAAEVLGDPNKRAHYDRHGTDPDDRRAQAAAGGFGGGGGFPGQGMRRGPAQFGDEINPEDLFNMFFGGGLGRGGFGGGFGPGIRVQTFGGGGFPFAQGPRRGADEGGDRAKPPVWVQLMPLLLLCGLSLVSYLPGLFTTPPPPMPAFRFEAQAPYQLAQQTRQHHVDYWLDPTSFKRNHVYEAVLRANPSATMPVESLSLSELKMPQELRRFESQVESAWLDRVTDQCRRETNHKQQRIADASGFLGIGRNIEELKRIHSQAMPGCESLRKMGYRLN